MTQAFLQFVSAHWTAISLFGGYAVIAAIATMPVPGEPVKLYDWIYAWLHTLINSPGAARFRIPAVPKGDPK